MCLLTGLFVVVNFKCLFCDGGNCVGCFVLVVVVMVKATIKMVVIKRSPGTQIQSAIRE